MSHCNDQSFLATRNCLPIVVQSDKMSHEMRTIYSLQCCNSRHNRPKIGENVEKRMTAEDDEVSRDTLWFQKTLGLLTESYQNKIKIKYLFPVKRVRKRLL